MLKKLSKYGNSTTLVIDRAILELLNMDESSMVKLQTDGKSLIITPVSETDKDKKVSYGAQEGFHMAIKSENQKQLEKSTLNQAQIEKLMPLMQEDYKKVFERHKHVMAKINFESNQEFQNAIAELAQKYDPATQSADYLKEFENLKIQFFPEIAELSKEIATIAEKYKNQQI